MKTPSAMFADLDGATVLITGGGSGIGAALALGFAEQGARVAIIDNDRQASERTVDSIAEAVGRAPVFVAADLRDASAARTATQAAAEALGGLRVLVNNVAWDDRHDFESVSEAYWQDNLAINLRAPFFVSQAAVPFLKADGRASIINFSSIAFLMNLPDMPIYLTAKAGIIGMTKGLAGKLGPDGVRVNAILPGMVLTERQKQLWVSDDAAAEHRQRQALKFSLLPHHMVGPCLFLASDCSSAMTAQSLIVDGGYI